MGKQLGRVDIRGSKTEHETRDYQNKRGNTKMQTKTRNADENRVDWKTEEGDTKKETWKQSREARHGGRERVRDTEGEQNRLWRTYMNTHKRRE